MNLPIDVIPTPFTGQLKFHWVQAVDTLNGTVTQLCEGQIPPSIERAVADLIALTKRLATENADLKDKIGNLMTKQVMTTPTTPAPTPPAPTGGKLGRR